jgi:TonB family protein
MTEVWTKWESQVINGVFPLRRFLGRSNHSVVFLTEYEAQNCANAAIKLVPADPVRAEAQLSHWRTVATLSHPHLVRLLDAGRCQLGGHQFLFVLMEYAAETLAEILPQRALTAAEVREMLPPALDALAFLHRRNLVQGQLKPPNFLVVNDQLKLASDTIHPAGEPSANLAGFSLYDPPEAKDGGTSAAGDIWGLGITLVEALTQHPPAWPGEGSETVSLPASLPPEFADPVRRCLSRNPANRPTIAELEAHIKRTPPAAVPAPEPRVSEASRRVVPAPASSKSPALVPAISVGLLICVAAWGGLRLWQNHPDSRKPVADISPTAQLVPPQPAAAAAAAPATHATTSVSAPPPAVLHQEIPAVARSARESIQGHIRVTVRVIVDPAGNVVSETLENRGPSKYFARAAREAAGRWKFSPAADQDSRVWLVQFEFSRSGTSGHAEIPRS